MPSSFANMANIIGASSSNNDSHYVALLSNGAQPERRTRLPKRLNTRLAKLAAITVILTAVAIILTLSTNCFGNDFVKKHDTFLWKTTIKNEGVFSKYGEQFEKFIKRFGKTYKSVEEKARRFEIFIHNMMFIEVHNAQNLPYELSGNRFSDLTFEEFKATHFTGYKTNDLLHSAGRNIDWSLAENTTNLPTTVNWNTQGCVTPVKNQGQCGSCWSFSCSGAIEGAYCVKHGTLISLSEQQMVDCSDQDGCNGGSMEETFIWLKKSNGLCAEDSYPYTGEDGVCQKCTPVVQVTGYVSVPTKQVLAMQNALTRGPVSVAIEADQKAFQFYSSGVFTSKCGTRLDHGVLAVGYGVDPKSELGYWFVKNSWGPEWGQNGYIMLARDSSLSAGQCGILLDGSFPTVV